MPWPFSAIMKQTRLIEVPEIDAMVERAALPRSEVEIAIGEAVGRCLRKPLLAQRDAPPFDRVMMDGYAINSKALSEGQSQFRIEAISVAGSEPPELPSSDSAIEVMTGAMLPTGADSVIPIEACETNGSTMTLHPTSIEPGQFVHRKGSEYRKGATILPSGIRLHPAHLALAASEGYDRVTVNDDLRVQLITTGDEVVSLDATAKPWEIYGTHATAIQAWLSTASDVSLRHCHVRDDLTTLVEAIATAATVSDLIVVCGAMSKGRKDFAIEAMQSCGFEVQFHRVAQRPGHPMAMAIRQQTLLFGLPGNPLAVLFTYRRHVLRALDVMRGHEPLPPYPVSVNGDIPLSTDSTRYVPCIRNGNQVSLLRPSNSGDLQCLAESHGFVEIPPNVTPCDANLSVNFWPWT